MPPARRKKPSAFAGLAPWSAPVPARTQVTREQVVRQALEILDQEGFDGLTMRRLAERLGLKAASLYNHVSDKEELLALMADAISAEIPAPDPKKPWRKQLETLFRQFRQVLMAHRDGARVLAATPPVGPSRIRIIEQILQALARAGLSADKVADAGYVLNTYVVGFVLDETLGRPADAEADERRRAEGKRWFGSLPREQFPMLVSLADELVDASPERRFELGLRALLDGFELRVTKKKKTAAD